MDLLVTSHSFVIIVSKEKSVIMKLSFCLIIVIGCISCTQSNYPSTISSNYDSEYFTLDNNLDQFPFQVIDSKLSRKIGTQDQLNQLDTLNISDIIKVENGGHILLAHYSGLFLEIEGDSLFSVSEASSVVAKYLHISNDSASYRVQLAQLYSKSKLYSKEAILRHSGPIWVLYPFDFNNHTISITPEDQGFCLFWEYDVLFDKRKPVELRVVNIFNELQDKFPLNNDRKIQLDMSQFKTESNISSWTSTMLTKMNHCMWNQLLELALNIFTSQKHVVLTKPLMHWN